MARDPVDLLDQTEAGKRLFAAAHPHAIFRWIEPDDVERFGTGPSAAQAAALADRIAMQSVMFTDDFPFQRHDGAGTCEGGEKPFDKFGMGAGSNETEVLAFPAFCGDRQSVLAGVGEDIPAFGKVTEGKKGSGELKLGEAVEKVGLIPRSVLPSEQTEETPFLFDTGVMAGGEEVAVKFPCPLQKKPEFDQFVAYDAGGRGSAPGIFANEPVHHASGEEVVSRHHDMADP